MAQYYVNNNAQPTGEHEVHTDGCPHPPNPENRLVLGSFPNCSVAVQKAKEGYANVDGCAYCCPSCHTR